MSMSVGLSQELPSGKLGFQWAVRIPTARAVLAAVIQGGHGGFTPEP